MIEAFTRHLVQRYGLEEVSQWYFEVWNEPNIDFWVGNPKEETYYQLYDQAAQAVKRVSPRLRVGGPSTAQAAWADRFLAHCKEKNIPRRFRLQPRLRQRQSRRRVRHARADFSQQYGVPLGEESARSDRRSRAFPKMPLIWTEYNAAYDNNPP